MKFLKYIGLDFFLYFLCHSLFHLSFYQANGIGQDQIFVSLIPFCLFVFIHLFLKGYQSLLKYLSYLDVFKVVLSNLLAWSIGLVVTMHDLFSYETYLLHAFSFTSMAVSYRLLYRARPWRKQFPQSNQLLIVGAGEACQLLLAGFERQKTLKDVVGLIDDDVSKNHMRLHGKKVLGKIDELKILTEKHLIKEVIVAIEKIPEERLSKILEQVDLKKTTVKIIPSVRETLLEQKNLVKTREVSPEDLLGRKQITMIDELIKEFYKDKSILITGAGGSIGSELCHQLLSLPIKELHCLTRSEHSLYMLSEKLTEQNVSGTKVRYHLGDIRDKQRLDELFLEIRPHIILHAAAHKHVPYMEMHEKEAIKNNVVGTGNVLEMCHRHQVDQFVLISTDKAVNPPNIMGASKRLAELLTYYYSKEKKLRAAMVRFGNVIGSRGSVIPLFEKQIRKGGPVTVTDPNVVRYFMTIPEAAVLVMHCAAMTKGGERFLLDMGDPIKIDDLVRKMVRLYRFEPDVDIRINYTGLRPGEKLVEELLTESEESINTDHPKIFIANDTGDLDLDLMQELTDLMDKIDLMSGKDVRKSIKRLLPEFTGKG